MAAPWSCVCGGILDFPVAYCPTCWVNCDRCQRRGPNLTAGNYCTNCGKYCGNKQTPAAIERVRDFFLPQDEVQNPCPYLVTRCLEKHARECNNEITLGAECDFVIASSRIHFIRS